MMMYQGSGGKDYTGFCIDAKNETKLERCHDMIGIIEVWLEVLHSNISALARNSHPPLYRARETL
eukprot:SAG11_NODE_530_length_8718_cov_12.724910_3_plen_65_part_00